MQPRFVPVRYQNDHLASAARSHRFDEAARVPFLCECDDPACNEFVHLTLPEFAALRTVVYFTAPGHSVESGDRTGATDTYDLYLVEHRRAASE
jgi:hypothetical protein